MAIANDGNDTLITPEVGTVITDPAQFIRARQHLEDANVKGLPEDFQAKSFVVAAVNRNGSTAYTSDFQAGDKFLGWSSGIAVSHKDERFANDAGMVGILRNPVSSNLEEVLNRAQTLGEISLNREQRDDLYLKMKSNTYTGALEYLKPLEHWAMGAGLDYNTIMQEQHGLLLGNYEDGRIKEENAKEESVSPVPSTTALVTPEAPASQAEAKEDNNGLVSTGGGLQQFVHEAELVQEGHPDKGHPDKDHPDEDHPDEDHPDIEAEFQEVPDPESGDGLAAEGTSLSLQRNRNEDDLNLENLSGMARELRLASILLRTPLQEKGQGGSGVFRMPFGRKLAENRADHLDKAAHCIKEMASHKKMAENLTGESRDAHISKAHSFAREFLKSVDKGLDHSGMEGLLKRGMGPEGLSNLKEKLDEWKMENMSILKSGGGGLMEKVQDIGNRIANFVGKIMDRFSGPSQG